MNSTLKDLAQWRDDTDAHLARLDNMVEKHGRDLQAKRAADGTVLTAIGETQSKHGQQLEAIEGKVDNLGRDLRKVGRDLESVQADTGMVIGRLGKVENKLQVITKTQDDHTRALAAVGIRLGAMDGRLDKVDGRLDKMDGRLDKMDGRLDKMDGRLAKIDETLTLLLNK
jgi:chromosome segregation ATPase